VLLDGRRQRLYVVGTAISSEFVYQLAPGSFIPEPGNYGTLYVKERFAAETLDYDGACNEIVGLLTPGARERPDAVLDEIERRLEPYGVFTTTPRRLQGSHQIVSDEIAQLRVTAVVLPAIFLAVAALVLNILMSRLAEQQRTTVGTLKAIGYSDRRLLRHYLSYGTVVGAAGGLVGAGAGYGLAQGMTEMYRFYFELPRLENRVIAGVYLAGVALAVAFAVLGTLRGVRAIVRLAPAEAMRARPPARGGAIALERFGRLWRRLGFRWQIALRSVWRSRWRTLASVFAAAMGSMLLLTTFFFMRSIDVLLEFQFEKVLRSDVDVAFRDECDGGALLEARRLPGVDHAEPLLLVPCEFGRGHRTKRAGILGVRADARLTVPHDRSGRRVPIPEQGLLMSRTLARLLDVEAGETVTVTPIRGLRRPTPVPVRRIVDGYLGMDTYADYDWLNRLVGERDAVSSVQLETRRGVEPRLALLRELKRLPAVQGFSDIRRTKANLVETLFDWMYYSVGVLVGLAAVIFFGSILTTSLIALAEREREVATLLVLGYERRQVGGIFLRESMLTNVVGAVLGLPLGYWLCFVVVLANQREAYRLPMVATPGSAALTVAFAVLFTWTAHRLVQRAIDRLDWLEAINAKE
jgi:putative ABC transport system permease protein